MPRNLSGVYTLPAGNPVVPGTTIDANWANSTLSDMANEITNSLSRTGAGGMLAPFRIDDGNVTGPGLSFLNETNTGYYRLAAGSTAFSVLGVNTLQMNTTSVTVPSNRTLNAQGNSLVGGTFGVTGAAAFASTLVATGAITALGGVLGNITAASGTSSFNDVTISGSLDMVAGSSATITGLSNPTNASDAANKGYVDTQDALKLNLTGGTMSGNLAMGNNLITGLGTAVSGGDATNKTYVDGQIATRLALAGGTMSGAIAMGTNKITGLGTPTADADAATKAYVDSVAQGLDVKGSVRAATTGNITLSGTQTIDGVAIGAGDRVLVKDQSTAANNGIYVAAAGAWSRAADADTWAELVGAFVFVEDGTTNDNSGWVCTSPPGGTLGVTAVTFEQFSGAGQINAGTGMTKTGNTLNVNTASSSRIVVGADEIDLAQTGVTAGTYKSVTVDLYGRVTAGTNPTTLAGYGIIDAYTQTQTDTLLNGKLSLTGGTMSGALAMGTSKITGLGNPTNAQDAATKTYVDTADALKLNLTGGTMSGALAMGTNRITGLGDPVNAQDAATKNYIDTIFGSTTSAAASAAAAASSATAASTSASNAASSASAASTSASNAATSLFNFRAQYLGPLASDPTVDGNGNAVTAGDLYWNTTVNETRIYNGTAWVAAYLPAAGYMDLTTNQTAAGVKTFSSNPILSGGTANGVAYLNGSQVLTTGSALQFDGSNLGLGVTPSAWSSSFKALNIGVNGQSVSADGGQIIIGSNYVQESGGAKYVVSAAAGSYAIARNSHYWYIAPSGTAGNAISFTQAMTLDANGSLLIGSTGTPTASAKVKIKTPSRTGTFFDLDATGGENWIIDSTNTVSSTDVLGIYAYGATGLYIQDNGNVGIGTSSPSGNGRLELNVPSGNNTNLTFYENGASRWLIGSVTGSNAFRFYDLANATERARITSTGAWSFGSSGSATGTSGQVLTSNGSGSAPSWATPGGVTSLTAGTGISVSGSTGGVTVTNSGVTSVSAGTGISVSASTGGVTISASGGSSYVFLGRVALGSGVGTASISLPAGWQNTYDAIAFTVRGYAFASFGGIPAGHILIDNVTSGFRYNYSAGGAGSNSSNVFYSGTNLFNLLATVSNNYGVAINGFINYSGNYDTLISTFISTGGSQSGWVCGVYNNGFVTGAPSSIQWYNGGYNPSTTYYLTGSFTAWGVKNS